MKIYIKDFCCRVYGEYHKCLTQDLPWIQQNCQRETTTYAESLIRFYKPLCQTYTTGIICLLILILYIICPQMKQNKIILRHLSFMCHRTVAIFVHQSPTEKFNDRHLRRTLQVSKQIFSIEQNMC